MNEPSGHWDISGEQSATQHAALHHRNHAHPRAASRTSRFFAELIDQTLLWGLIVAGGFFIALPFIESPPERAEQLLGQSIPALFAWFFAFCGLVLLQTVLIATSGQSIGKKMLAIRIVRTSGAHAGFVHGVLLRSWVAMIINSAFGVFWFVDSLFIYSDSRRCLHDHIADTMVVNRT